MASGQRSRELVVDGRRLAIANLDRVVFPQAGTTKAQLLDYYLRVADAMLPHLRDRLLHMHRYPEGVGGPSFWQKACPEFRPEWIQTVPVWSRDKHDNIEFCVIDETAALLWAVNIGSIELHTSLHRRDDLHRPTAMAFDLDPGEGVGLPECCAVGLRIRDLFAGVGLLSLPKTSGGKGLRCSCRSTAR
jgi:bifunctional non-homologous end joining protein LigD